MSKIEWTDATWNPVRGCTKITPGCANCYASTFAERWRGIPGHAYEQGFDLRLVPHKLTEPLRWRNSRLVFVNSMSDLFQGKVPDDYIAKVWRAMALADWHTYQILTKRPKRMARVLANQLAYKHVWLGTSVEDRKHGLPRIDDLRETPAAVRFLSVEPLLEDLGPIDLTGIDWVIVGGESGPGARQMLRHWVTGIQTQCLEQGVPFFFKQWGGVRKKETGREFAGRTWDAMPEIRNGEHPGRAEVKRRLAMIERSG